MPFGGEVGRHALVPNGAQNGAQGGYATHLDTLNGAQHDPTAPIWVLMEFLVGSWAPQRAQVSPNSPQMTPK